MPRPERSFQTDVLILRRRDFGEADRVLTVLTPHHGRREVIAKGARKPNSTRTGQVELYTRVEMLINTGRDLDIAAQAVMRAPYLTLREDLQRGAYAAYVSELLIRFTGDEDHQPSGLFGLLDATYQRLCAHPDPRLVARYYEMHLLGLVGFMPELSQCVVTRAPVAPQDQYFSYADGGVVSPEGARHSTALIGLSLDALKVLRFLQRSPFDAVERLALTEPQHRELERVQQGYITHLLERRLQSVDFLRRVRD
jgi:DNA repair protein RecO (recombination protein O)